MPIAFNNIPTDVRVPLFYAEMDPSQANTAEATRRRLMIGQKLAAGSAVVNTPYIVATADQAIALFGRGSMLARMVAIQRLADPLGETWCIAVADDPAGAAATCTITVTGPATASGTIPLYVAGQLVRIGVSNGDSAATIAGAINTAINAAGDLPITTTVAGAVVTPLVRWKGQTGNDVKILHSYRGFSGGEALPAGVGLAITPMAGGTSNPSLTAAIIAMGDESYDYVVHPYADATNLDLMQIEMGESSGRWSWSRLNYGHAYSAIRGTFQQLVDFGTLRNDPHHTNAAIDVDCPHPCWEYAAAYAARNAVFLDAGVARPTHFGVLTGLLAPRAGKRFLLEERQQLLKYGIATSRVNAGALAIDRAITSYRLNEAGQADNSYLDSETLHQSAYVLRDLESAITSQYGRHSLASDGTRIGDGASVVTPSVIKGALITRYHKLEELGIVENTPLFAKYLIVERAGDTNRVNVLFPPDYVNQLRVLAVRNQFRLQYPAQA